MTQVRSREPFHRIRPPTGVDLALARNRGFAAAGGHEGAVVFPKLRLFVITCLDPRVDPAHVLGLALSDAMIVRNAGGLVTPEVIKDVAFIGQLVENLLPDGPLFEVAVIHHTQCGTGALADDAFRSHYAERIGADESTLRGHAILDPAATVKRDVERLRSADAISPRINVSGHVYDVVSGLVQTIFPADPHVTPAVRAARAGSDIEPATTRVPLLDDLSTFDRSRGAPASSRS